MGSRIKELRKYFKMTQEEFASELGIKQNTLSRYEAGQTPIPESLIELIRHKWRVDVEWIRGGEGSMFEELDEDEEITTFFADVLKEDETFKRRLVELLAAIPQEAWDLVDKKSKELANKDK